MIEDALDSDLCDRLLAEFPPLETVTGDNGAASNKRFSLPASEAANDPRVSSLWREFLEVHTSDEFAHQLIDLFGDHIRATYPSFESDFGPLDSLRTGVRRVDSFENADVLLDAQISVNTPVTGKPSSVRKGHLDNPDKLFGGLFYMRSDEDESTGGDLELYRFKTKPRGLQHVYALERYIDVADTVSYRKNALVIFLNSIRSLHGVTVRSPTQVPRYFVNLIAEVERPIFDLTPYQANWRDKVVAGPDRVLAKLRG